MYQQIQEVVALDRRKLGSDATQILLGDWNAALTHNDRSSGHTYEQDKVHQAFVTQSQLLPIDGHLQHRPHTYQHACTDRAAEHSSRIDDILLNHQVAAENMTVKIVEQGTQRSDHQD